MILVSGPTAVGKTDFVDELSQQIPSQIINADMGQLYVPLSIGTAKLDLSMVQVPHHLFDVIDTPTSITVLQYYQYVSKLLEEIWSQNQVPIIVGGSLFYLQSLLFPPQEFVVQQINTFEPFEPSWQKLNAIDPQRAAKIHPNDLYRIARALSIWQTTGTKPSLYKPAYKPLCPYLFIYLDRERSDLYTRIDARVHVMIDQGWVQEVEKLLNTEWEDFLVKKSILGYPELISYCNGIRSTDNLAQVITQIQQETRNYAKRQNTFWRGLHRKIQELNVESQGSLVEHVNLTFTNHSLYINQLLQKLKNVLFLSEY